jgi:hypothetical protein
LIISGCPFVLEKAIETADFADGADMQKMERRSLLYPRHLESAKQAWWF